MSRHDARPDPNVIYGLELTKARGLLTAEDPTEMMRLRRELPGDGTCVPVKTSLGSPSGEVRWLKGGVY